MVRGQADYGALAAKEATSSISDMGEVAARLGSIVTYDKRGDVIDFDNFEEPVLKWITEGPPIYGTIGLDSESAKSGSQSLKFAFPALFPAELYIAKGIPVLASLKIGLEASWSYQYGRGIFHLEFTHNDGTTFKDAEVEIDLTTKIAYIYDFAAHWKEVATNVPIFPSIPTFHTVKLVVDFSTGYYKRLLIDSAEYDISSEAFYSVAYPEPKRIVITLKGKNQTAALQNIWIDDVIWTQAEP